MFKHGLSTEDIDAARDAARRSLIVSLPETARHLLYRLSIVIGRFSRSLALAIGELTPPVMHAGECLDQLVGPWIEGVGDDLFRVSPLAGTCGSETLSETMQERVHETIATRLLRDGAISVDAANRIVLHAISGRSPRSLVAVALAVLSADSRALKVLAEHVVTIRALRTDRAIYPAEPSASGLIRVAQFKLVVAAGERRRIGEVATALLREVEHLPAGTRRRSFEVLALASVLATLGAANYVDNWIALLTRLNTAMDDVEASQELRTHLREFPGTGEAGVIGGLFAIGSVGVRSVRRLESIIVELDKLSEGERALCLRPIDSSFADYSTLVHGPWSQMSPETLDARDAAVRYERMADITRRWGIAAIPAQCVAAQGIMLDEFQDDSTGAIAVVEDALNASRGDVILIRALARIRARRGESAKALGMYRLIADRIEHWNAVDRAFTLRDAALSAGQCNEWKLAEKWTRDAQSAAKSAHVDEMDVLAIGLEGDVAVAAFRAGDVGSAFVGIAEAMRALAKVDPEETLRGAHCHRVIRHAVLWMYARVTRQSVEIDGQPIGLELGNCSNPSPARAIKDLPLAHIDVLWYKLAEAEVAAGVDAGARQHLDRQLIGGRVPVPECALRFREMMGGIERLNAGVVARRLPGYLDAAVYLQSDEGRDEAQFDLRDPARGQVPVLDEAERFGAVAQGHARDVVLAFGVRAALSDRVSALDGLGEALDGVFGGRFPGSDVLDQWRGQGDGVAEPERGVIALIRRLGEGEHVTPYVVWLVGIRFFGWIGRSNARGLLTELLGAWLRRLWSAFSLYRDFVLDEAEPDDRRIGGARQPWAGRQN